MVQTMDWPRNPGIARVQGINRDNPGIVLRKPWIHINFSRIMHEYYRIKVCHELRDSRFCSRIIRYNATTSLCSKEISKIDRRYDYYHKYRGTAVSLMGPLGNINLVQMHEIELF